MYCLNKVDLTNSTTFKTLTIQASYNINCFRTNPEVRYHIERTAQTTTKFENGVEKNKLPEKTLKSFTLDCLKKCKWRNVANSVVGCFPFFNWIKAYQFREWFVGDLVSGLTVGIVHIPQSLLMV